MVRESSANNPFTAELPADFVSGGNLFQIGATEALSGKVLIPRLQQLQAGDTLYVSSETGESLEAYNQAHVTRMDSLSKTRQNAFSGIFFGQLSLIGASGEENTQMVAVKPFSRDWLAADEYKMAHTINTCDRGQDKVSTERMTFQPLAFHRLSDGHIAVITAYEQAVKSFDNSLWVPPDFRPDERAVRWALGNAAASLIFLHSNALVHTDYQVKNTAVDPNGPRIIDITGMKKVGGVGSAAAKAYIADLTDYIRTINVTAHEYHTTPYVTEEQVREDFVKPYAEQTQAIFGRRAGLPAMVAYGLSAKSLTEEL